MFCGCRCLQRRVKRLGSNVLFPSFELGNNIWLCVLFTSRSGTMKNARKQFEKAISAFSPSDQEAFVRQNFGRVDFLNTMEDNFPARLYLNSWEQFRTAKELIAKYCPKAEVLWKENEKGDTQI